jgi:hypothetical protein
MATRTTQLMGAGHYGVSVGAVIEDYRWEVARRHPWLETHYQWLQTLEEYES